MEPLSLAEPSPTIDVERPAVPAREARRLVPTILVVDDEREVVVALEGALRAQGYRVATACNGADAIEKAILLGPELVITDLLMPVVDGIAFAKAVRTHPATATTRIVLSSGVSERSVRMMFDGYDAFLQKPYELDQMRRTVAELLAHGR